mgnify:CR=1 FL=1
MEKLEKLFNTDSFHHHAYGIESHGLAIVDFDSLLDKTRFSSIFARHYDSLKIDDAREIKRLAAEKQEKESIFIISFTQINNETQNTLLKLIEEPRPKTVFFFIFPNEKNILPTVVSRMEIIHMNRVLNNNEHKINVADFIKKSLQEKFEEIKKITDKKNKDENIFSKGDLQHFLDDLEIFSIKQKPTKKRNEILQTILDSRAYMNAKGASIKMILENMSLHL